MALDSSYTEAVYVEVFERTEDGSHSGVDLVTARWDVTRYPDHKRRTQAVLAGANLDRNLYGVRIAKYTVQIYETF